MSAPSPTTPPPRWRAILAFCLPALLLGLGLRIILCQSMPLAFFSPDTNEFFASRLFGGSRTFLPKLVYGLPGLLNLPLLPSIALIQHALGLAMIFACGWLCTRWLSGWRWWIVPFTCLIAVQPTLLWYEHFALPDAPFTFTLVLACLAGDYFYRQPSARSFAILFATLFVVAGTRQEGFLFTLFGVSLVVRVWWGNWRAFRLFVPLALFIAFVTAKATRTNQGGYMLLTSLVQWAPDQLWSEPGLSPHVVKLREQFRSRWPAYPDEHNDSRKVIVREVENYVRQDKQLPENRVRDHRDALCQRLAFEIALRNCWRLPGLAFNKFRAMHIESPSPDFGATWAHDKQLLVLFGKPGAPPPKERQLVRFYLGRDYATRAELEQDLPRIYRVLPDNWLSRFQERFYAVEYGLDVLPELQVGPQRLPALPIIYFLAITGFGVVFIREGRSLSDKQLWLLMLLLQAFVVFLTGSLRSRYRLSFEPWLLLGVFCVLDFAAASLWRLFSSKSAPAPAPAPRASADTPSSDTDRT